MATDKQRAANRANARKSTGPKSTNGKARARRNAYRHGFASADRSVLDQRQEQLAQHLLIAWRGQIDIAEARLLASAEIEVQRVRMVLAAMVNDLVPASETSNGHGARNPPDVVAARGCGSAGKRLDFKRLAILTNRYLRRAVARRDKLVRLCFRQPTLGSRQAALAI